MKVRKVVCNQNFQPVPDAPFLLAPGVTSPPVPRNGGCTETECSAEPSLLASGGVCGRARGIFLSVPAVAFVLLLTLKEFTLP